MIEIEKRVLMDDQKREELKALFNSKGKFIEEFKRFTMVNVTNSDFSTNKDVLTDLRVRTTGKNGLLTFKTGNWHKDSSRNEYELTIKTSEIKELMNILVIQGYKYFVITYIHRSKYKFKDFDITLDKYQFMDQSLMEVELQTNNEDDKEKYELQIDDFLKKHKLTALDSKETINLITRMNSIPKLRVDFTKISIDEWYNTWKDYIYCIE